jgi:hypothetical protein
MRLLQPAIAIFPLLSLLCCRANHSIEKITYNVSRETVAEGKRMTMLICGPCHYNPSTKDFSGKKLDDAPGIVGQIYASNITRDPEKGIGDYTPAALAYLIRTGISKDGKLMPYMQRPNLADKDLNAIIAFLGSNDKLVKPSSHVAGITHYSAVGKVALRMTQSLAYPDHKIQRPNTKLEIGKYLVDNLACYHCHSRNFTALNIMFPEKSKGYMGGGNKMKSAEGKAIKTPNLTFHSTGIQNWTEEEFKRAVTNGLSKDNAIIAYPMPLYAELTAEEVASIYTYLKTIPVINNKVYRTHP